MHFNLHYIHLYSFFFVREINFFVENRSLRSRLLMVLQTFEVFSQTVFQISNLCNCENFPLFNEASLGDPQSYTKAPMISLPGRVSEQTGRFVEGTGNQGASLGAAASALTKGHGTRQLAPPLNNIALQSPFQIK